MTGTDKTYEIQTATEDRVIIGFDYLEVEDIDASMMVTLSPSEMRRAARMLMAQADAQEAIDLE